MPRSDIDWSHVSSIFSLWKTIIPISVMTEAVSKGSFFSPHPRQHCCHLIWWLSSHSFKPTPVRDCFPNWPPLKYLLEVFNHRHYYLLWPFLTLHPSDPRAGLLFVCLFVCLLALLLAINRPLSSLFLRHSHGVSPSVTKCVCSLAVFDQWKLDASFSYHSLKVAVFDFIPRQFLFQYICFLHNFTTLNVTEVHHLIISNK